MKTSTKLMLIAMLALAAGGTCPSDVNNDGTVGINDFLQVLGDWGPCPNATVVGITCLPEAGLTARVWSDATLQVGMDITALDVTEWGCPESIPTAGEWVTLEPPPLPSGTHPVDIAQSVQPPSSPSTPRLIYVAYTDGTVYARGFEILSPPRCKSICCSSHREFAWVV